MSRGLVNKSTGERIPSAPGYIVDKVGDLSALHTTAKDKAVSAINEVADAVNAIDDGTSIDSFADVENALADKADTDMVAADFDATASYTAGNYCIYEGKFYKFKNNHSGAWAAADVDEIKIAGELSSLKSGLIDLNGYKANRLKGSAPKNDTATVDITDLGNTIGLIVCTTYRSYALYTFKAETSNLYVQKVADGGTYPPTITAVDADTLSIANTDTGSSGQYMILT